MARKKKILIADDEIYIRILIRETLTPEYIVFEASNGEEAINVANSQKPDLIIMDIMMPKLDGISVCSILKSDRLTKEIPVIITSVRTDKLDRDYAREIGADDFLAKPFSLEDLLRKVKQYT